VLKNKGTYVSSAFSMGVVFLGPWKSITEGKKMTNFLAKAKQADLQFICKLAEEGKLKPVIEKTFALEDLPKAMRKIANGSSSGKLLITI
jgi:NADPH:quinone reductase-like Zn-dependent oxidoreductase